MPPTVAGRPAAATVTYRRPHHVVVAGLLHILQPWAVMVAVLIAAAVLRFAFPGGWTVFGAALAGVLVTAVMIHHVRFERSLPARLLPPVTALAAAGWITAFTAAGLSRPLLEAWLFAGGTACVIWDWRITAGRHGGGGGLAAHFAGAADAAGVPGTRLTNVEYKPRKVTSVIRHVPGVSQEELAGRVPNLESGAGFAPGSLTLAPHPRQADSSIGVFTDPAALFAPLPWPGPSSPGESIAVPLRLGRWQDGEDLAYDVRGHHLLVQGLTGSGKSMSVLWCEAAETVSRRDAAFFAADVSANADQFLWPLAPALHGCATTPDKARDLLAAFGRMNLARAAYMAAEKQVRWNPGSRLTHLTLAVEEFADLVKLLRGIKGLDDFESLVRTFRARGIRLILSAQRFDFTQVPTFIRSQMAGTACFGVENSKDAEFGLSGLQRDRNARPELWKDSRPGMAFLDAPSIPDLRRAMPCRYYSWGSDSTQIGAYAALPVHEAARRPLDDITGEAYEAAPGPLASTAFPVPPFPRAGDGGAQDDGDEEGLAVVRQLRPVPQRPAVRPSEQEAAGMALAQIAAWRAEGRKFFIRRDWDPLLGAAQRSTGWLYNTIFPKMVQEGLLARHADGRLTRWEIMAAEETADS